MEGVEMHVDPTKTLRFEKSITIVHLTDFLKDVKKDITIFLINKLNSWIRKSSFFT